MALSCRRRHRPTAPKSLAQINVKRPALFEGRKFHLRLFVIVASLEPLRVYVFGDGRLFSAVREFTPDPARYDDIGVHITNSGNIDRLKKAGENLTESKYLKNVGQLHNTTIPGLSISRLWASALCSAPPASSDWRTDRKGHATLRQKLHSQLRRTSGTGLSRGCPAHVRCARRNGSAARCSAKAAWQALTFTG